MSDAATAERCSGNPARHWAHGMFCWNELVTHDEARARKFYANTLGWTFDSTPMPEGGTYWTAKSVGQLAGGIFPAGPARCAGVPEGWLSYIAVDDVDARVEKALVRGARLMRPIFDVPGVGRIALLREPGGAGIGWMTPAKEAGR